MYFIQHSVNFCDAESFPPECGHSLSTVLHCAENIPFHPMMPTDELHSQTRTTPQPSTDFNEEAWGNLRNLSTHGSVKVAPNCYFVFATPNDDNILNVRTQAMAFTTNAESIGQPGRLKGSNTSYKALRSKEEIDARLALQGNPTGAHNFPERVPMDRAIYAGELSTGESGQHIQLFLLQELGWKVVATDADMMIVFTDFRSIIDSLMIECREKISVILDFNFLCTMRLTTRTLLMHGPFVSQKL